MGTLFQHGLPAQEEACLSTEPGTRQPLYHFFLNLGHRLWEEKEAVLRGLSVTSGKSASTP